MLEPQRRRGATRGTVSFAIILLILAGVGVYAAINWVSRPIAEPRGSQITLSNIARTQLAGADGKMHHVEAQLAYEVDPELGGSINREAFDRALQATLERLDYDAMARYDGLDYVKEQMMSSLEFDRNIDTSALTAIYVTNFASDFVLPLDTLPPTPRENGFNRLFGNWR